MELKVIKAIRPEWIAALTADGWTVARLATADISQLTPYRGIDDVTAQKIIGEARQKVNWEGYINSQRDDTSTGDWGIPPRGPKAEMSVRVARIKKTRDELYDRIRKL